MRETTRQSIQQASVVGGALMIAGIGALLVGIDPSAADAILKFWPTGLIGIGVALMLKPEEGR